MNRHFADRSLSLKNKVTLIISALLLVVITLTSYFMLDFFEKHWKESISRQQFTLATTLAQEIDDKLEIAHSTVIALSGLITPDLVKDPAKASRFLKNRASLSMFDNGLFLFSTTGKIIGETPFKEPRTGMDFSYREYFQTTIKTGKPYVGNVYRSSQAHGHPAVMFTAPVRDAKGNLLAVIAGSVDLLKDNFFEKLTELKIGRTGYVFLVSLDRTIVLHPDKDRILKQDIPAGSNKLLDKAIQGFEGSGVTVNSRGINMLATYKHLKNKNWILGVVYPTEEAYSWIFIAKRNLMITVVFMTALVLFAVWMLMSYIMNPLLLFTEYILAMQKGAERRTFSPPNKNDEIGKLSTAFTDLMMKIQGQQSSLEAEKEQLAVTLRSINEGVITTDTRGIVLTLNKTAEDMTGWTQNEAGGRMIEDIFNAQGEDMKSNPENSVRKVLHDGAIFTQAKNSVLTSRNGRKRIIADSAAPIRDPQGKTTGTVLVFRDITEEKRMREELSKAEKLESLGILAGGIAHDFNNILTAIMLRISMCKTLVNDEDHKTYNHLFLAEKACMEAQNLTSQLLTFSKGGAPVRVAASIREVIMESALFAVRGAKVDLDVSSMRNDLWPVEIDMGQISRVIHNLFINADQAMPKGGIIFLSAENVIITPDQNIALTPGKYVKISVRDQGVGIPEESLAKIFDPYFTTKDRGIGLGLSASYSIIKNHNGLITVSSEINAGTTFAIYLPASDTVVKKKEERPERLTQGTGGVLIVDDEESVRDTLVELLQSLGYEAVSVPDGSKALDIYKKAMDSGQRFDVVIMDLIIPGGMGGEEATRRLLEIDPRAYVVVSSGYSRDSIIADYRRYGFKNAINKPYTVQELSGVMNEIFLDIRQGSATAESEI